MAMKKAGHGEAVPYWDEKRERWEIQITYKDVNNQSKRKKLVSSSCKIKDAQTRKDLSARALEFRQSMDWGLLPEADKITFGKWLDRWLDDYVKPSVRVKPYEKCVSTMRSYIQPTFANVPLKKITSPDLQRLFNRLLESGRRDGKGLSPETVRLTRGYVIKCLKDAIKVGLLERNVAQDTVGPKLTYKEASFLSDEDAIKLLNEARKAEGCTRAVILLALNTGMRLGEIFGMSWDNVDFSNNAVRVTRSLVTTGKGLKYELPKTSKSKRQIAVSTDVTEELRFYKEQQEYHASKLGDKWQDNNLVVTNMFGGEMSPRNFVERAYRKLFKATNVNYVNFHALRHTHATMLLKQGLNPKVVQERLGHANIQITLNTYGHVIPDMQQEAVQILTNVFSMNKTPLVRESE